LILKNVWIISVLASLFLALFADSALATTAMPGGGTGLQWETPIQTLVRSLTGPVAYGFLVLGLLAIAANLIWGGEIGVFLQRTIYFVMVGSLIAFATGIIGGVMFAGAVIQ
jgi:type IV secretion system protein VirB2